MRAKRVVAAAVKGSEDDVRDGVDGSSAWGREVSAKVAFSSVPSPPLLLPPSFQRSPPTSPSSSPVSAPETSFHAWREKVGSRVTGPRSATSVRHA